MLVASRPDCFTRFNTATGQGNVASPIQAAHQLGVYMMASHTLLKGRLASQSVDVVAERLADLPNAAQRAMQFNRSTPGLGASLVDMSTPEHLDDMLRAYLCALCVPAFEFPSRRWALTRRPRGTGGAGGRPKTTGSARNFRFS